MGEPRKNKMLLGQRLKLWRKKEGQKGYQLARNIGISPGSLSEIENGKSLPSAETIAKLHENTSINILWLLTGKGEMNKWYGETKTDFPGEEQNKIISVVEPKILEDKNLAGLVEKLVKVYSKGSPIQRANILGYLSGVEHQSGYEQ